LNEEQTHSKLSLFLIALDSNFKSGKEASF